MSGSVEHSEAPGIETPCLLIAVPQLGDPNFFQAVILLIEHTDEGAFGLILNHQSEVSIKSFCDAQEVNYLGPEDSWVHIGGPVQQERAFLLHNQSHPEGLGDETEAIGNDIHLSFSMESLAHLADQTPSWFKIVVGYAGWGAGQLGEEIVTGAWLLAPLDAPLLKETESEDLWEAALDRLGIHPTQLQFSGAIH